MQMKRWAMNDERPNETDWASSNSKLVRSKEDAGSHTSKGGQDERRRIEVVSSGGVAGGSWASTAATCNSATQAFSSISIFRRANAMRWRWPWAMGSGAWLRFMQLRCWEAAAAATMQQQQQQQPTRKKKKKRKRKTTAVVCLLVVPVNLTQNSTEAPERGVYRSSSPACDVVGWGGPVMQGWMRMEHSPVKKCPVLSRVLFGCAEGNLVGSDGNGNGNGNGGTISNGSVIVGDDQDMQQETWPHISNAPSGTGTETEESEAALQVSSPQQQQLQLYRHLQVIQARAFSDERAALSVQDKGLKGHPCRTSYCTKVEWLSVYEYSTYSAGGTVNIPGGEVHQPPNPAPEATSCSRTAGAARPLRYWGPKTPPSAAPSRHIDGCLADGKVIGKGRAQRRWAAPSGHDGPEEGPASQLQFPSPGNLAGVDTYLLTDAPRSRCPLFAVCPPAAPALPHCCCGTCCYRYVSGCCLTPQASTPPSTLSQSPSPSIPSHPPLPSPPFHSLNLSLPFITISLPFLHPSFSPLHASSILKDLLSSRACPHPHLSLIYKPPTPNSASPPQAASPRIHPPSSVQANEPLSAVTQNTKQFSHREKEEFFDDLSAAAQSSISKSTELAVTSAR
ncbi:hypothetical protein G7046_g9672 [Stylonectria norvegica]|nr:hypothetical protein G7046_g9672 [Stylonectria norvegica]